MTRKMESVDELIKRIFGQIILENFETPNGCLVTVDKVETLKNLQETKIYLKIFPTEKERKIFELLQLKTGLFQKELAQRLSFHSLPKIKLLLS
ncbi:MAG: ribosome-binding factor A [Patescibacteria group bacterium]|nr:ribosome-binding factor A [Patescibacteria group bacterium]